MSHQHHNTPGGMEERELPEFNLMQRVKRRMYAMRNGALAGQMRSAGVNYFVNFGLNIPQVKDMAQWIITEECPQVEERISLAEELWHNASTRESRLLAPMIYPADAMTAPLAQQWLREAQTVEVADHLCFTLLRRLPFAQEVAYALLENPDGVELGEYGALRLLLNLLILGKADKERLTAALAILTPSPLTRGLMRRIAEELEFA